MTEGTVYRGVVVASNAATGEIIVNIPSVGGNTRFSVSPVGRSPVNGVWKVPPINSIVLLTAEDRDLTTLFLVPTYTFDKEVRGEDLYGDHRGPIVVLARNDGTTTITKGTVVYDTADGADLVIGIASAADPSRMPALGIALEDIPADKTGKIAVNGYITGINTSGLAAGVDVYVANNGAMTITSTGLSISQIVGKVVKVDATDGAMLVNVYTPTVTGGSGSYNGSFTGTIYATGGVLGGTTEGWVIQSDRIESFGSGDKIVLDGRDGEIYIGTYGTGTFGASVTPFYVNNLGQFSLGDRLTWNGSTLDVNGTITADGGSIAGWNISPNTLTSGSGTNQVTLSSDGSYALWAGSNTALGAPFRVGTSGDFLATNASIQGSVKATSGSIGGWVIQDTQIRSVAGVSKIVLDGDTTGDPGGANAKIYVGNENWGNSANGFYVDDRGRFGIGSRLTWDPAGGGLLLLEGDLDAQGARIANWSLEQYRLFAGASEGDYIELNSNPTEEYRTWAGHPIVSLAPFRIRKDGGLFATNASIQGSIKATAGSIGGWVVQGNTIQSVGGVSKIVLDGNLSGIGVGAKIYVGNENWGNPGNGFYVDNTGKFGLGDNFTWNPTGGTGASGLLILDGQIQANEATFAGWSLRQNRLFAGSSIGDYIELNADPAVEYRTWAGHPTAAFAPFRVKKDGGLFATNASIEGGIKATSGSIGNWIIQDNKVQSIGGSTKIVLDGDVTGGSVNAKIYAGNENWNNASNGFYMDNRGKFGLGNTFTWNPTGNSDGSGLLTLSGNITAQGARLAGWYFDPYRIYSGVGASTTGNYVELNSDPGSEFRMWAGHGNPILAPFAVRKDGFITSASTTLNLLETNEVYGRLRVKSATNGSMGLGVGVSPDEINNGLWINANNYWYDTGAFRTGSSTNYVQWTPLSNTLEVSGRVIATSGSFTGTITASSGGYIGGWTINADTLSAASVGLAPGTYPFYAGANNPAIAPFRVTNTGALTAQSGNIGGWTINATSLSGVNVGLDPTLFPFYAGSSNSSEAPFRVHTSGSLVANNASIQGFINATSGSFSGAITASTISGASISGGQITGASILATQGQVGGWTLGLNSLTGNNVGLAPATYPFYAGDNDPAAAPFHVTTTGFLKASNASISGFVSSTAGSIGGWLISSNSLTAGSGTSSVGMNSSGGLTPAFYAGNADPTLAPFRVTSDGVLTASSATITGTINTIGGTFDSIFATNSSISGFLDATAGSIGGFLITASSLSAGTGASTVGMVPGSWPFFAGGSSPGSALFRVDIAGNLNATNASLTNASISGRVVASSGSIGGWDLSAGGSLSGGNAGQRPGTWPFFAGSTVASAAPFRVRDDGAIWATQGTFAGTITGSSISGSQIDIGFGNASFHVDLSGNVWVGQATNSSTAPLRISNTGVITLRGAGGEIFGGSPTGAGTVALSPGGFLNVPSLTFDSDVSRIANIKSALTSSKNGAMIIESEGSLSLTSKREALFIASHESITDDGTSISIDVDAITVNFLGTGGDASAAFKFMADGSMRTTNGTGSFPSYSFRDSTNTGMYRSGTSLAFAVSGVTPVSLSSAAVTISRPVTISAGNALTVLNTITGNSFSNANSTFTVNSGGAVAASSITLSALNPLTANLGDANNTNQTVVVINNNNGFRRNVSRQLLKTNIIPLTDSPLVNVNESKILASPEVSSSYSAGAYADLDIREVLNITPVLFESLIEEEEGIPMLGFIAEDVMSKFPLAAIVDGDGSPLSWAPSPVVVALVGVIRELDARVEQLEAALA